MAEKRFVIFPDGEVKEVGFELMFKWGRIVGTPGALDLLSETETDSFQLMLRHLTGDFGDITEHDEQVNLDCIAQKSGKVLSAYELGPESKRLWIMTDIIPSAQNITTIMLPEDY